MRIRLGFSEKFLIIFSLLFIFLAQRAGASDFALLSGNDLRAVFRQCSRDAPHPASVWKVSDEQAQNVFDQLQRIRGSDQYEKLRAELNKYFLQYAGFVVDNNSYIYVHAIKQQQGFKGGSQYIEVCDGGDVSWGIVYDERKRSFTQLSINGPTFAWGDPPVLLDMKKLPQQETQSSPFLQKR